MFFKLFLSKGNIGRLGEITEKTNKQTNRLPPTPNLVDYFYFYVLSVISYLYIFSFCIQLVLFVACKT